MDIGQPSIVVPLKTLKILPRGANNILKLTAAIVHTQAHMQRDERAEQKHIRHRSLTRKEESRIMSLL